MIVLFADEFSRSVCHSPYKSTAIILLPIFIARKMNVCYCILTKQMYK